MLRREKVSPEAASSAGLGIRRHQEAVRRILHGQLFGPDIGGVELFMDLHGRSDLVLDKPPADRGFADPVGIRGKAVSAVGHCFDPVSFRTELADGLPYGITADLKMIGQGFAGSITVIFQQDFQNIVFCGHGRLPFCHMRS